MDRSIVYSQEQGRSTDFLFAQRSSMIGLSKLAESLLGTGTFVAGLAVSPTSPASLSVSVSAGQIYELANIDSTAYGVLTADTTHQILKQGVLLDAVTLACAAPLTNGYSINYLIEAAFSETDTNNVVLPYFNSANPSQPLSGQNNSGAAQATERQGQVTLVAKAGAAATTGTQTTPAADAGYVGLYVVTVAYGQTTITSSNITQVAGAPILSNILTMMQTGSTAFASDTGTAANTYALYLSPAPAALVPGMTVGIESILHTNNGASTLNVNGFGALPIQSAGGVALQGNELVSTYGALFRLNHAGTAWVLLQTTGGSLPVVAGSKSEHAPNLGQFIGSFANPGYIKIPTWTGSVLVNVIVQFGKLATSSAGPVTQTFPVTFPTAILGLAGFPFTATAGASFQLTATPTTSSFSAVTQSGASNLNGNVWWIAIGY